MEMAAGQEGATDLSSQEQIALDPATLYNLTSAQQNKLLNAKTSSGVRRQAPTMFAPATQQPVATNMMSSNNTNAALAFDPADLTNRLLAAEESKALTHDN